MMLRQDTFCLPSTNGVHMEGRRLDLKDPQQGGLIGRQRVTSLADSEV